MAIRVMLLLLVLKLIAVSPAMLGQWALSLQEWYALQ